jgi:hypothetical protein
MKTLRKKRESRKQDFVRFGENFLDFLALSAESERFITMTHAQIEVNILIF